MKGSRALGLVAASATASLQLLSVAPLGTAVAAGPKAPAPACTGAEQNCVLPGLAGTKTGGYHLSAGAIRRPARQIAAASRKRNRVAAAAWLPKGCHLVEIGPANAGYTSAQNCRLPQGFRLPNGYMLVRGSMAPSTHSTTGASG